MTKRKDVEKNNQFLMVFLVIFLFGALSGTVFGGGFDNGTIGIKTIAMGAFPSGIADDASGVYFNPGALVFNENKTLSYSSRRNEI